MTVANRRFDVCVLPGDGIGPEVTDAAGRVLEALAARFEFDVCITRHPAGEGAYRAGGDPLPTPTIEAARRADGVLVGAMDVAALPAHVPQPLRTLRRALGVVASVRRNRAHPGVPTPTGVPDVDVVVVRELTEGLFGGIEYAAGADAACAVRVVTREASIRVARIAFQQARARRGLVTAVHKRGAMPRSDAVFLDALEEVAADHPDVRLETRNVDACAMELVQDPRTFDTVVCTNAFGDILSDVAAALAGGLGLAASACLGARSAYFEPVHGTAPDIAGQGIANPIAAILSAALMLRHVGATSAAAAIEQAVAEVLVDDRTRTPDLGGRATTDAVTDAVCARVGAQA